MRKFESRPPGQHGGGKIYPRTHSPKPSRRLIEVEGIEVRTPADVPAALASLATAIGDGVITIEEGTAAGNLLQTFLGTYETAHRLAKSLDPAAL